MRRRLVVCISGGLMGFALSGKIGDALDLAPVMGMAFSAAAGLGIGYVVSTLMDVFAAKPDSLIPGRQE